MPATIYEIEGRKVVFGLDWEIPGEAKNEAAALRKLVKDNNASFHIRHEGQGSVQFGLLLEESLAAYREQSGEKKGKASKSEEFISAAMLLANLDGVEPNSIWVEMDADGARMAALINGDPSPEGDFYGSVDELQTRIEQICGNTDVVYTFYGHAERFAEVYIPLTLSQLLEGSNVAAATLASSDKGLSSNAKLIVLMGIVLLGFFGFTQYQKHAEQKKLEQLRLSQQQDNPVEKYKKALEDAKLTAGVVASEATNIFFSGWEKQQVAVAGWNLERVTCSDQSCKYKWTKDYGDNASLTEALGKDIPYEYSNAGTDITYSIPVKTKPTKTIDFEKAPSFSAFMLNTGSFAQNLVLIEAKATITAPVIFPENAGVAVDAVPQPIKYGKITIDAKLALLKEIVAKMPDNTTFNELVIKMDGNEPTFTLQGRYYVKN
jgi:hypothetical protein